MRPHIQEGRLVTNCRLYEVRYDLKDPLKSKGLYASNCR